MSALDLVNEALSLDDGAHLRKVALQVNPFAYGRRHPKPGRSTFESESAYNDAVVAALLDGGVEAIAVTDHHSIDTSLGLLEAATGRGIVVFPGFETTSNEGVHLLCVFDPSSDLDRVKECLGALRLGHDQQSECTAQQLITLVQGERFCGLVIAPHVESDAGGLLTMLKGKARERAWRDEALLAVAVTRPPDDIEDAAVRNIVSGRTQSYRRERPLAVIHANDVSDPVDVGPMAWTGLRMSSVSLEGLRQAFLDPEARVVRTPGGAPIGPTAWIETISWSRGFLDGERVHLNPDLNVLIGGRGTGKSTVIESLRFAFALQPVTEQGRQLHGEFLDQVLGRDGRVTVSVRTSDPADARHIIVREVGGPPEVFDENGASTNLSPSDVVPIELYGQHELADVAADRSRRPKVIERFVGAEPAKVRRTDSVARELEKRRVRILELRDEREELDARLAALPRLQHRLEQFEKLGIDEDARRVGLFEREAKLLGAAVASVEPFRDLLVGLEEQLPVDTQAVGEPSTEGLPSQPLLREVESILHRMSGDLDQLHSAGRRKIDAAAKDLDRVITKWEKARAKAIERYEKKLAELDAQGDVQREFVQLRKDIELLLPLQDHRHRVQTALDELERERCDLLDEKRRLDDRRDQRWIAAAGRVTSDLDRLVMVAVQPSGDRSTLHELLRRELGGSMKALTRCVDELDFLSPPGFAQAARSGEAAVRELCGVTAGRADDIARLPDDVLMAIEQLDFPPAVTISLNVARDGAAAPHWRDLDHLSTGQKATALLVVLFLEGAAPLVIDQPEDDLDNAFVASGVVPRIRAERSRRQMLFSTHNANIPVLGDAALILALESSGAAGTDGARASVSVRGAIDDHDVRKAVESLLEGGRRAFEERSLKYDF